MAVTVSRSNIQGHAHLVAATVTRGEDTVVVFFDEEQWVAILKGAALELEPCAMHLNIEPGVCDQ